MLRDSPVLRQIRAFEAIPLLCVVGCEEVWISSGSLELSLGMWRLVEVSLSRLVWPCSCWAVFCHLDAFCDVLPEYCVDTAVRAVGWVVMAASESWREYLWNLFFCAVSLESFGGESNDYHHVVELDVSGNQPWLGYPNVGQCRG